MKTAEEILDKIMMEETGMVNYPEKEYILQAMEEYANLKVSEENDKWQIFHDERMRERGRCSHCNSPLQYPTVAGYCSIKCAEEAVNNQSNLL